MKCDIIIQWMSHINDWEQIIDDIPKGNEFQMHFFFTERS